MKFSRYLLSYFIDISQVSDEELVKTLNDIGLEVESLHTIAIPKNVVIGKVIEKTKHPDADKLSVCKVDIGNEVLQIVCGAKNVAKGQFVPVALVGAKLSKLTIAKSTLRGVESNGMICSSVEIDLPKIEDGILELDSSIGELVLGKELSEYEIFDDSIIEVGITPNRGDCLSVIGIARDLAVALQLAFKMPSKNIANNDITPGIGKIFNLTFDNNLQSSLFYKAVSLNDIEVALEIKLALAYIENLHKDGLKNILHFATYMMGVLFQAYKFDNLNEESKITLQVKKDITGVESVYVDNEKVADIGIGANPHFQANMNANLVIIEASYIPPRYLSQVIYDNKIEGDKEIVYRSTRGSSPLLESGMCFLCDILAPMSVIYSSSQEITQEYPMKRIDVYCQSIANIIGNKIEREEMLSILKSLNFTIVPASDDSFIAVNPPPYRHDIEEIQDVAEEILRINGIDNITSLPQPFKQYKNLDSNYALYKYKRLLAYKAIGNGFYECIHYVFYKKEILESYGYTTIPDNLDIANPITSELNTLRTSLIPAMLDTIVRNQNYGFESIKLFEIGSIYDDKRNESVSMAFCVSGNKTNPKYPYPKGEKWDFYSFASMISNIVGEFTLTQTSPNIAVYHQNICAKILKQGKEIGIIGKISPYIAKKLEINNETFICEIDFDRLFALNNTPIFKEFSKYQRSIRDISVLINKNIPFGRVKEAILSQNLKNLVAIIPLDVYENLDFGDNISLSFRIIFQSTEGTLTEEDLKIDNIIMFLESEFGAKIR